MSMSKQQYILRSKQAFSLFLIFPFSEVNLSLKAELAKLSVRVDALPPDLAKIFMDDLKATAEERLGLFERLAAKRR